jgi:glucan biosynthesis protein C
MQNQPNRIYAFDHLKTTMMLLVLVFHAGVTYIVVDLGIVWPFKDPHATSLLFDLLLGFINCIFMPVFFVISGFMTSMLFTQQGGKQMLKNRFNRLFYPFLVFLLLLYPITAVGYFNLKFSISGSKSPFYLALNQVYNDQFEWRLFRPIHLWFLYYLILFCIGGYLIVIILRKTAPKAIQKIPRTFFFIYSTKAAPLLFALITFILLCLRHQNTIETPGVFSINGIVFITYAFFFGVGWLLYHQREYLERFKKGDVFFLVAGVCVFFLKIVVMANSHWSKIKYTQYILAAIHSIALWFLIFGFMGLYLRCFNKYSARGRYLADASYWIYLVHFPFIFFLQAALINVDINVYFKFLLVVTITFFITIITYNYMVRDTFIGQFLNGKKYQKGLPKL